MSNVRGKIVGKILAIVACWLIGVAAQAALAETIVSVTQVSFDVNLRPQCTAVRMNMSPTALGSLPADACALGSQGANGPDRITKTVYDAAGQTVQVVQGVGTSAQRTYATYAYSPNGKVVDSIDANGNRTHMVYDGFDRLVTLDYPSTVRPSSYNPSSQVTALATAGAYSTTDYETYGYDANGNTISTRRRDAQILNDCFDNLNRIIVHYVHAQTGCTATGGAKDVYSNYDGLGRITAKRFASNTGVGVTYSYDGLGRVQSTTDMNGRQISYLYNAASARTRLTFPDANWQPYTLDNLNRVTFTGMGVANVTLTYDSLGRVVSLARTNGAPTALSYDAFGRLYSLTQDLAGTGYDIGWTFSVRNPAGQVTKWSASTAVYDYKELTNAADSPSYDGLNRDVGIAAVSGGYDARGNLTKEGTTLNDRAMVYDVENRLLSVAPGNVPTAPYLTLTYDPEGRLSQTTYNGAVTQFLYDGTNLIGEYDSSGTMQRRYVHGPGTDQPLIQFNSAAVGTPSAVSYIYTNYQGSVIALADSAGYVTDYYKYGPYGEPRNAYNTENFAGSRFRYTGQYALPEAKLYYYKARVYDPKYGRFLQTDPIGSRDDLDLYAYTGGDPINRGDPSGTQSAYEVVGTFFNAFHQPTSPQEVQAAGGTQQQVNEAYRQTVNHDAGIQMMKWEKTGLEVAQVGMNPVAAGEEVAGELGILGFAKTFIADEGGGGPAIGSRLFFRRGAYDTVDSLKQQAAAALAHPDFGIHGVSVSTSSAARAGQVVRAASENEITSAGLSVIKTGKNPDHYTVELPRDITKSVVQMWNSLFH